MKVRYEINDVDVGIVLANQVNASVMPCDHINRWMLRLEVLPAGQWKRTKRPFRFVAEKTRGI